MNQLPEKTPAAHVPLYRVRTAQLQPNDGSRTTPPMPTKRKPNEEERVRFFLDGASFTRYAIAFLMGMAVMFLLVQDYKSALITGAVLHVSFGILFGATLVYYYFRRKWKLFVNNTPDLWDRVGRFVRKIFRKN